MNREPQNNQEIIAQMHADSQSGDLKLQKMRAEAASIAKSVEGIIGRTQAIERVVRMVSSQPVKYTEIEIEELVKFFYEFAKGGIVACLFGLALGLATSTPSHATNWEVATASTAPSSSTTVAPSPHSSHEARVHRRRHHHRAHSKEKYSDFSGTKVIALDVPLPRPRIARDDEPVKSFDDRWHDLRDFAPSSQDIAPMDFHCNATHDCLDLIDPTTIRRTPHGGLLIIQKSATPASTRSLAPKQTARVYTQADLSTQQESGQWMGKFGLLMIGSALIAFGLSRAPEYVERRLALLRLTISQMRSSRPSSRSVAVWSATTPSFRRISKT
jgi:hypothetical protein